MRRLLALLALPLLAPSALPAQSGAPLPSSAAQIASAVAPLPEEFRAGATVLGYAPGRKGLVPLRTGSGAFVCLADDPAEARFHTACYHRSLERFMARGRALRTQHPAAQADSIRTAEVLAGKLPMPKAPAALYSLTGTAANLNAATGAVSGARPLYVVYIPFATAESTGLPTKPGPNSPSLMSPGTPKAHIMFVPQM